MNLMEKIVSNIVLIRNISYINWKCFSLDVTRECLCVGAARIGWPDQKIVAGTLAELVNVDLGSPLHSMVIVGTLHPLEEQFLKQFYIER